MKSFNQEMFILILALIQTTGSLCNDATLIGSFLASLSQQEYTHYRLHNSSSSNSLPRPSNFHLLLCLPLTIMALQYPAASFLLIIVMLNLAQFSSCRDIPEFSFRNNNDQRFSRELLQSRSWNNFNVPAPQESRKGEFRSYRVSDREVPGGPNPLHN